MTTPPPSGRAALLTLTEFSSFAELEQDNRAYWHARTPAERLAHMEELRVLNYGDEAARPLQRVLEVIERPQG
jgi:hypothetical protein